MNRAPRIRRLSATLANQIAAGEVVERPASVVKELLENSVDSGASRLDIDLEQGGVRLIRIRDDGCGIHGQDLGLALSRHATSKVDSLDALESVRSLGFRGEALPSLASVARLELCSRVHGEESAWRLVVEGSDATADPEPASHPPGTTVTVRDLFFNTPARRKFLRTERTELRHVEDVIRRIALSRFDLEVRFSHNARSVWMLPSGATKATRLRRLTKLCGASFCEQALQVDFEAGDMRLSGWLGAPGFIRKQSDLQYFFLNRRMVRDRVVTHAIRQAYEGDLAPGSHPGFVLYLDMDPSGVDVNVHPAKHEVRFRDARSVHDFVFRGLHRALSEYRDPSLTLDEETGELVDLPARPSPATHGSSSTVSEQLAVYGKLTGRRRVDSPAAQRIPASETGRLGSPLGVVAERYLVTSRERGLVVIDLAKAGELVQYRRLKQGLAQGTLRSRPLLVPVDLKVSEAQAAIVDTEAYRLQEAGLELRRWGPESVSLRQVPVDLEPLVPESLIQILVEHLTREQDLDDLLRTLASAVGSSPAMTGPAALASLLRNLELNLEEPGFEVVWTELSEQDMEQLFRDANASARD